MNSKLKNSNKSPVYNGRSIVVHGLLAIFLFVAVACSQDSRVSNDTYTCPMHPTVLSDKPGMCPICGMDLVRKGSHGEDAPTTKDLTQLLKSPSEIVVGSVETIKAVYKQVQATVQAQGVVTYDTRNIYTISARVGGRLEKVFLNYPFQPVTKGQKLVEIYSPELITAQRELLYLLDSDAQNTELIQSAKTKIELLGVSATQVQALIQRREVQNTFTVYSPYSGYLIMNGGNAPSVNLPATSAPASAGAMDAMASSSISSNLNTSQPNQQNQLLREGSYVSTGETLFRIVNPASLRIELDLPASQAVAVKKDAHIELDFGSSKEEAVVDFIQPFFISGESFVKLRVYARNTQALHIGHLVKARIDVPGSESLWLPKEAVLDLGLDQIVFIKDKGIFKPKKVLIGGKADSWIEVKGGLTSSDEVAANGQFLVDSESFINVN